jgi:hypothetical protein
MSGIDIRKATPEDAELIIGFIRELAEFEKMERDVVAVDSHD